MSSFGQGTVTAMPKWLIIAFFCVGIYLGFMFGLYAILNKIDPYDEKTDWTGDGDGNKAVAAFWPFTIPLLLIFCVIEAISSVMDLIRKYQKDGDNDG